MTVPARAAPRRTTAGSSSAPQRSPSLGLTAWGITALVAGALGLVAAVAVFPPVVEGVLTATMILLGPGAALRTWVRMPPSTTAIVVPTFGIAAVLLAATAMVTSRAWNPEAGDLAMAVVLITVGLSRWEPRAPRVIAATAPPTRPRRRGRRPAAGAVAAFTASLHGGLFFIAAAVLLFTLSVPGLAAAPVTVFGLLASGGPGVALVGAALCGVIGFLWSVRRGAPLSAAVALVVVVLVFRLPTALATSEPLYSWTYKHLGVVDFIAQNGHTAGDVDIYSGWPGFFAAMAWFVSVTGVPVIAVAQGFIVGVDLLLVVSFYAAARAFRLSPTAALVGSFLASVANWVGQDYFSPQAVAFVLGITVVTLVLRSRRDPAMGWLAVPFFAAIVVSHQLTPYWLVGVTIALGVLGRLRPRYLGLVFAAIAGGYLWLNREALGNHQLISGFDILSNASSQTFGVGSLAQTITSLSSRGVSVVLLGGAALVVAHALLRRRGFRRWRVLGVAAIAFTSFALLLGQGYGGEAIFRVYLYAIPGCMLLVAPVLARLLRSRLVAGGRATVRPLLAGAVVVVVSLAALQASYGAWFVNLVTRDSVAVAQFVADEAPSTSILISPLSAGPGRMTARYADFAESDPFFDASLSSWEGWIGRDFADDEWLPELTDDIRWTGRPAYILVNEQMSVYAQYNGLFPDGALDAFVEKVRASPDWRLVVDSASAQLFVLEAR